MQTLPISIMKTLPPNFFSINGISNAWYRELLQQYYPYASDLYVRFRERYPDESFNIMTFIDRIESDKRYYRYYLPYFTGKRDQIRKRNGEAAPVENLLVFAAAEGISE